MNVTVQEAVDRISTFIAQSKQSKMHVSPCLIDRQTPGSSVVKGTLVFARWKQVMCPMVEVMYRKMPGENWVTLN